MQDKAPKALPDPAHPQVVPVRTSQLHRLRPRRAPRTRKAARNALGETRIWGALARLTLPAARRRPCA
jgi:hypothetical protein